MIELRKVIVNKLREYHDKIYYHQASKDNPFPYVVYNFPNSFTNDDQEVFNLDVDIWDNKDDTTELETIASDIWRGLHKYRYIDENIQFSIYRDNKLQSFVVSEMYINHRKFIFHIR